MRTFSVSNPFTGPGRPVQVWRLIPVMAAAVFFSSCASPANKAAMVPASLSVGHTHKGSVSVETSGGRETNPMWTSQVSSQDFRAALIEALNQAKVFSSVVQGGNSQYHLQVTLRDLKQPFGGFDMTVTAVCNWVLTRGSGNVIWRETITTPFKATMGDSFYGVARLRKANEGAMRENIQAGIQHISKLRL